MTSEAVRPIPAPFWSMGSSRQVRMRSPSSAAIRSIASWASTALRGFVGRNAVPTA